MQHRVAGSSFIHFDQEIYSNCGGARTNILRRILTAAEVSQERRVAVQRIRAHAQSNDDESGKGEMAQT